MVATEVAKPFDATPIATALEFRKRNRRATGDMVDAVFGASALQVSVAGGGASINIEDGRAIVQSALYELTGGPLNKTVGANGGGSNRTDYAALTYDDSHTPGVYARVLEGTALTQNDIGTWDFPLATWQKTPAGAITNLVDLRAFRGSPVMPCTSTLRPPAPSTGMIAYETDTGRHITWTGTAWTALRDDTGYVTFSLNGPQASAWSKESENYVRKINGIVHLRLTVRRWNTNGLGTADPDGSTPLILSSQFRPPFLMTGHGLHSRSPVALFIYPDGSVRILPLTADIPAGRTVYASATWAVG